jgi:plasmid stabilization system protein ParE
LISLRPTIRSPRRAAQRIAEAVTLLQNHPYIGRAVRGEPRELVISHGRHGCVALYRVRANGVVVLALRHQREAGFHWRRPGYFTSRRLAVSSVA